MHSNTRRVDAGTHAGTATAAMAILLVLGLAGCAAELNRRSSSSAAEGAPYVGVFTGEYVDGKPLYRFPSIYVVGSRSSVGDI